LTDYSNIYNDPIIGKKRSGEPSNPYLKIEETLQVVNGRVVLTEIPNRFNRVKVNGGNITWFESTGLATQNSFNVNYSQGIVAFDAIHNNKSLSFVYYGEGVELLPDDRIYVQGEQNDTVQTVRDKFKEVDTEILEQKNRVDEQLRSVPQPSEVVDMRVDRNGVVFPVGKDRIDAEQLKIESAYKDKNNKAYASLKARIDGEQTKIEEAYRDRNNVVHSSLKVRIDSEQDKIEAAYQGANGKSYTSLKNRFDEVDNVTSKLDRRTVKTISDLKNGDFKTGEYVRTLGYYTVNDGGAAEYFIDTNSLKSSDITLNNGLKAHYIPSGNLNILQFGAKRDGVTDNTSYLRLAVAEAEYLGGRTIYFPSGEYVVSGYAELSSNIHIQGELGTVIKKVLSSNEVYVFTAGMTKGKKGYGGGGRNISFSNIDFVGYLNGDQRKSISITLNHVENLKFSNCRFINAITNGHAIDLAGCNEVDIYDSYFIGAYFIDGREYTEAIQIDSSTPAALSNNFSNYDSLPTKNVRINNCKFLPTYNADGSILQYAPNPVGSHGFTGGMYYEGIIFKNNLMIDGWRQDSDNWRAWLHFYGLRDSEFTNNRFINSSGVSAAVFGFYTTSNGRYDPVTGVSGVGEPLPNQNIKISQNYFEGFSNETNAEPIIRVYGAVYNSVKYRSVNFTVNDNQFTRNYGDWLTNTGGRTLIHFNMFSDVHITNNRADLCRSLVNAFDGWSLNVSNNTSSRIGVTGVTVQDVAGVVLQGNTFSSTRRPFEVLESTDLLIKDNICTNIAKSGTDNYSLKLRNTARAIIQSNIITTPSNSGIAYGIYLYTFTDTGSAYDVFMFDNHIIGFTTNKVYTTGTITNYVTRNS
jgi:hypothetical protein